jgi:uncharacterized protein
MKRLVYGVILSLFSSIGAAAQVVGQGMMTPPPQVVVSAQGEMRIVPDRANVMIGVQSRAKTAAMAGSENARRQRAIIDTLRAIGLTAEQITTQGYNVYPETRYDQSTQQSIVTGYVVSNMVRAELRSVDQVGRVIDAALAKGANQISSLDFYSSNVDEARRAALASAVAKARADADALARAAGGSLGGLLEVASMDIGEPPIIRKTMAMAAESRMANPTPIEAGSEVFRVSVTTRWLFVPAAR